MPNMIAVEIVAPVGQMSCNLPGGQYRRLDKARW